MQLTFLQAAVPLTKKYTKRSDGSYETKSYPLVSKVTTHVEEANTPEEFAAALRKHAEQGNCLHTGSLDKALQDESRKGHHDKDEKRSWITLDLDGIDYPNVEAFITECLPSAFHNVSYIIQHSPSSGIKTDGLRMHLYFLLDRPEDMSLVCNWIKLTNLVTEKLRNQVTLSTSKKILSYPLDWIANKNGRVVYIASPECVGFDDPVNERITAVDKEYPELRYVFAAASPGEIKTQVMKRINELRVAEGLKPTKAALYEMRGENEVLKKTHTDRGRIHDTEQDSDTIMRCNLDGGDSHAYFYYIQYPKLIRNHKGEPAIYMEAFDPDYYEKVAQPAAQKIWEKHNQPYVFRNIHDDKYYIGIRRGQTISQQPTVIGSEAKIEDFYLQYGGLGVPDPIESWSKEFNPTLGEQWNPDDKIFNTWRQSDYMKNAIYRTLPPQIITKIIGHAVGGAAEYEHFINWIAYIYQKRTKTGTAWVLHGTQGTGKGLLVDQVLRPIFGKEYVVKQQARNLKAEFNAWMEEAIVVNLDEFDLDDAGTDKGGVKQALKMWVTDDYIPLRAMRTDSRQVVNYANFILTTNAKSAMSIDEGDRRFNFGVQQDVRLDITPEEVAAIKTELQDFANYLSSYEVDEMRAHTCMSNEAKRQAMALSKNSVVEFADAIQSGDLQYFVDGSHEHLSQHEASLMGYYKNALSSWIDDVKNDRESFIPASDMILAYKVICSTNKDLKLVTFKSAMRHKGNPAKRLRTPSGKRVDGWKVKWDIDEETLRNIGGHIKAVKTEKELEQALQDEVLASPKEQ